MEAVMCESIDRKNAVNVAILIAVIGALGVYIEVEKREQEFTVVTRAKVPVSYGKGEFRKVEFAVAPKNKEAAGHQLESQGMYLLTVDDLRSPQWKAVAQEVTGTTCPKGLWVKGGMCVHCDESGIPSVVYCDPSSPPHNQTVVAYR